MTVLRSGALAAWTTAWLAGSASSDDVLSAVASDGLTQVVVGLADTDRPVALSQALIAWRRRGAPVRLVLPVAGDVRGVPGPAPFLAAALEAGEAVHGGGLGLVASEYWHPISSAPPVVRWQAFEVGSLVEDYVAVPDAGRELADATRACTSVLADLAGLGGGRWTADIAEAVAQARSAGDHVNLPPGHPPRAVQLVAQAQRLQAIGGVALAAPSGGAVDRDSLDRRADALRELTTAVRRALLAGYNAVGADR